eukprot:3476213-Alexandrium_andersonii.AAC.1
MSASLVGSEMCIRDSRIAIQHARDAPPAPRKDKRPPHASMIEPWRSAQPGPARAERSARIPAGGSHGHAGRQISRAPNFAKYTSARRENLPYRCGNQGHP